MNSMCVSANPFQVSVLNMIDGIINTVHKTDDFSFHNPLILERYAFIEIASKLRVTFAVACFQYAFDEYYRLKPTLHGVSTSEKIWCYLVCTDTDLKKSIALMKQLKKGFTYQLMENYLTWSKNRLNDTDMQRYIETLD